MPENLKVKGRPGQNFPMFKAVKNHMRHIIAYTLNMEEIDSEILLGYLAKNVILV